MVSLRPVDADNVGPLCDLEVWPGQEEYVARNERTLAEANYEDGVEAIIAIYVGNDPAGLAVTQFWAGEAQLWLWRFMIGAQHQGHGVGRAALGLLAERAKAKGVRWLKLSYVDLPGPLCPRGFYESCGFRLTGEMHGNEAVMRLDLRRAVP